MFYSEPAVATGTLKVYSEHLKSANNASQFATNKFFLVLDAATFSALIADVELAV